MSNTKLIRGLMASTIVAGFALATPAFAQEATPETVPPEGQPSIQPQDAIEDELAREQLEDELTGPQGAVATGGEIVVTGTRIARPNLEQSSPVTVVGAEEIAFEQPTSAEDFIRDLPGTTPSIGPQTNNGSDGSARVNLRGLGSNRNLVLLNERRVTPRGTDAVVDLNVVPVALIERVDVFTGGASVVYGADAVSGVVNFITRRDFAGIDIQGLYGVTERGDGRRYKVDLTMGANFDDGRGNAAFNISYTDTDPVLQGERDFSVDTLSSATGLPFGSSTAAPATINSPPLPGGGGPMHVDPTGTMFLPGVNLFNFAPLNLFQTPLERWSIFGQARYEVSPAIEAYMEGMFVYTNVELNLAPAGVFGSTVNVPLNSPFLSDAQAQQLCANSVASPSPGQLPAGTDCDAAIAAGSIVPVGIGRRFVEAGPRRSIEETNMFHVVAGLRGPLTSTLDWDIYANHGKSDRVQTRLGWGSLSRVRAGVAGCPAGSPAGCVPFNLFGPVGSITPEMLNFIDVPSFFFADTDFTSVQGVISGDIGFGSPLAAEPIGVAMGLEHRRYGASSRGDALAATPGEVLGAGAAGLPIVGEYDTSEAFTEVNVPLVSDRPFFHNLSLEGGVRFADYSTSGGNWSWKIGGSFAPIRDIKFRGVYARSVRAPNIAELFQPQVTALTALTTDPCQGTLADIAARGANFQALCLAQLALVGAPAALLGTIQPPIAGQIQSTQGGNPNLDPEVAKTLTVGVVIQPQFVPGLAVTVDYWDIEVTGAITTPSSTDVIGGCFSPNPIPAFCSIIFRNPATGSLSGPAETTFGPVLALSNLGLINTNGVDWTASYGRDLGFARLNWNLQGTWTDSFKFQANPLSVNRECLGFYSVACGAPQPEWAWTMRTTLSFPQGTDVSLRWAHISGTEEEPGTGALPEFASIDAYDWFDLTLQQHIADTIRLTLTVQNLFDKDPPVVGNTIAGPASNSGNTFPTVYDPLGRRYTMGVRLSF